MILSDFTKSISKIYSPSEANFLFNYIHREKLEIGIEVIAHRLNQNEPIDYILGYTYFYDVKINVDTSTLIPRPETEELVEMILQENKSRSDLRILDIGTGSGCIAIALAKNLNSPSITAIDVSESALSLCQKNAFENNVQIDFIKNDILNQDNWLDGNYDIIVSNPPYISRKEADKLNVSVKNFEPGIALFVEDEDPLLFYKEILGFAKSRLHKNGLVYFETHQDYQLNEFSGFQIKSIKDMSGNLRFLKCKPI
jgi:release factor glutamine methyltransferase